MSKITNTGNATPDSLQTQPSMQPAQRGTFTSGDTPPHQVSFTTESFVESVHGGIAPSALSPSASSSVPAMALTPSSAAIGTREPTSEPETTMEFWRGPHADEADTLTKARITAIDKLASKFGAELAADSNRSYSNTVEVVKGMSNAYPRSTNLHNNSEVPSIPDLALQLRKLAVTTGQENSIRAAALAEARYLPAGKFASLYWRRVLDATNSAISIERQNIIDGMRTSNDLKSLYKRRNFAVDEHRSALGYGAAKAGATLKAGSRSISASDLRLMKLRAAEIAEWRRNARETATHLWQPMHLGTTGRSAKREHPDTTEQSATHEHPGTTEQSATHEHPDTTKQSATHDREERALNEFPVADIVERFNGLVPSIAANKINEANIIGLRNKIAVAPDQLMQPFHANIASHDDVRKLNQELSRSFSDFCIIERADLEHGWEPMVVFAKLRQSDGNVHWLRVTRHGDAFANNKAALGLARNADMPRGNLKTRQESEVMRQFKPGDPHNANVLDMSRGYGSKDGRRSRASTDVLTYFLSGHRQTALAAGNGVASLRVWLPQSDLALANSRAMKFLGYDVPYHHLDGRNFMSCLEEAGCKVSMSEISPPTGELPSDTQIDSPATVMRLAMEDRSSYAYVWKPNDLSQAFVVTARSVDGKPLSEVAESTVIAGSPVDLLNQLFRAGKTIDRLEMGDVRAFDEARIFPESGTKTAEAIQSEFNRKALALGVPYHSIRDFDNFSRVFAHQYPSAFFSDFAISDETLQQALDHTHENILIEFIQQESGTNLGETFRYCYEAPGRAGDAACARPASPKATEFKGPPSALLQAFKEWKPELLTMRLLSTGPLRGPDETSPEIPAYLQGDLKVLVRAGLPIMANDADQLREFGNFIYRNLGSFPPDINAHTYAKYVESWNANRPELDRIGVSYRFRTSPPLDIDFSTPGTLVQYRSDDGMLSNIVVFETTEGIRWFSDDHSGVKVPEELETLARTDNWYDRQVVDIIKFTHPELQFFTRDIDGTESVESMSVDLSASDISLTEETRANDPANDTEVEEVSPQGTSLGRRKNRDDDNDEGNGQGTNPRSGKRAYTASDA